MSIVHDKSSSKKQKGKGFYLAFAICLTAVTVAGWTTYRSVKNFMEPPNDEISENITERKNIQVKKQQENIMEKSNIIENTSEEESPKSKVSPKGLIEYDTTTDKSEHHDEEIKSVMNEHTDTLIIYPTDKTIIKEFSDGKPVYSKTLGDWRVHDGTDFRAPKGSIIKAIGSGTVKDIYNDPMYGMTIVIEHDQGFTAYYAGLGNTTLVNKDEQVKSGQDIGSINDIPIEIADEPHLHLMINKDGQFIDPILILEKDDTQ